MLATDRQSFVDVCLRKLSGGNIEINVSDEAIDDCVDQALKFFQDYHYDGAEKIYYKYAITDVDKTNGYITVPDNCIGVTRLFSLSTAINTSSFFDIRYQIALNDLYTFTSVSMVPYYMAFQSIQFIEQLLVGLQPIRFNRKTNQVHLDMDWNRIPSGNFIILETYFVVDPDTQTKVWADRWLGEYCAQLIKLRWGSVLTKFRSVPMPGGVSFNGDQIYSQAQDRIDKMESEMINKYSEPVEFIMG